MASEQVFHPDLKKHPAPNPVDFEATVYQKGLHYERSPFTFKSNDWQGLAEQRMSIDSKGYLSGNAGTGETTRKNCEAFAKWSIVPRRMINTSGFPDLSVTVFGEKFPFPIAAAPVGVQRIFNFDGEVASATAAAKEQIPFIMSTASSTSIEDVGKANGSGTRWYQLYWPMNEHNDITASILDRAKKAGFTALFVTLDAYHLGWRPGDMDNGQVCYAHQSIKTDLQQIQSIPSP